MNWGRGKKKNNHVSLITRYVTLASALSPLVTLFSPSVKWTDRTGFRASEGQKAPSRTVGCLAPAGSAHVFVPFFLYNKPGVGGTADTEASQGTGQGREAGNGAREWPAGSAEL